MNILAHLYLSGENENVIVGNFIGDFVKGRQIQKYPEEIAKGIRLHREIDYFTDNHPIVKNVNTYFNKKYGKHSGIVTDIVFDHFLSNNWKIFSEKDFDSYIKLTYELLNRNLKIFPFNIIEYYPFMVINNWLKLYQSIDGLQMVLKGMSKRTSLPGEYKYAIFQVKEHYNELQNLFIEYFFILINRVNEKFKIGINLPKTK